MSEQGERLHDAFKLATVTNRLGATWDHLNAQTQEDLVGFPAAGWLLPRSG